MHEGITVCLAGTSTDETARALLRRLVELGCRVERVDDDFVRAAGGRDQAARACGSMAGSGTIAVCALEGFVPDGARVVVAISRHDTPDFAAEKILDELDSAGVIDLDSQDYTPEEEERIRARLADLGYIE
ncbi:MAG TPA: hypothetical protein PLO37_20220 [Candidatus Hydrogenedentes bacterium]|nr:hypothetical protein [Candidatus Hydrogenedentota bacterium]HPG69180.1 hypothetical protein [Candidatus Hydrogenedentota bacterium]